MDSNRVRCCCHYYCFAARRRPYVHTKINHRESTACYDLSSLYANVSQPGVRVPLVVRETIWRGTQKKKKRFLFHYGVDNHGLLINKRKNKAIKMYRGTWRIGEEIKGSVNEKRSRNDVLRRRRCRYKAVGHVPVDGSAARVIVAIAYTLPRGLWFRCRGLRTKSRVRACRADRREAMTDCTAYRVELLLSTRVVIRMSTRVRCTMCLLMDK